MSESFLEARVENLELENRLTTPQVSAILNFPTTEGPAVALAMPNMAKIAVIFVSAIFRFMRVKIAGQRPGTREGWRLIVGRGALSCFLF